MWMYFFWSQYLVIWYGNVPVETRFLVQRFFAQPWQTVAWVVFVVGWLVPFAYLLKRLTGRPPQRHTPLVIVALFGLVAIFLERVLVVFPSVSATARLPFGARDVASPRDSRPVRLEPALVSRSAVSTFPTPVKAHACRRAGWACPPRPRGFHPPRKGRRLRDRITPEATVSEGSPHPPEDGRVR